MSCCSFQDKASGGLPLPGTRIESCCGFSVRGMASRRRCPRPEQEQQQQQEHHRKLCGFITLVLEPCPAQGAQGDGELEQQLSRESHNAAARGGGKMDMAGAEPGAACWLEGRGAEACVVVEHSTVVLRPLGGGSGGNSGSSDSGSSPVDSSQSSVTVDEAQSPVCTSVQGHRPRRSAARGRKRKSQDPVAGLKRKGPAGSAACSSILQQLAVLVARNAADLQGRILGVSCRGGLARAVVMLDLYLPATFWSERNSWRPSVGIAAAFSHFSCDWKERRSMLERISASSDFMSLREPSIWDVGECLVLGCQLHKPLSDAEKQARFDLPTMFQSLPAYNNDTGLQVSCIQAHHGRGGGSGIWDIPDEILVSILTRLGPKDLVRVASVCRHTRSLAVSIMPCMKLKLFPHQQAAVSWMLQRELHPKSFSHPLFRELQTEDGLPYHVNCVTGELSPEFPHKEVKDFRGGLFCDEPGLGKTVTALSLILKTQGTLSEPPDGVQVRWCERLSQEKVGYYEINADASSQGVSMMKRCMMMKARSFNYGVAEDVVLEPCVVESPPVSGRGRKRSRASSDTEGSDSDYVVERPKTGARKSRGRSSQTRSRGSTTSNAPGPRRKLFEADISVVSGERPQGRRGRGRKSAIMLNSSVPRAQVPCDSSESHPEPVEIWVQCDACRKWRKLPLGMEGPKEGLAWFCSMNMDPDRQECSSPEESWEDECIRNLPGFVSIGVSPGQEQNVLFFKSVLKEHACLLDSETKKALEWLAGQNVEKLVKAATSGLELPPGLRLVSFTGDDRHHYFTLFRAFGLVESRGGRGVIRWRYPASLDNLILDSEALKIAYSEPVDGVRRLYLSRATLVVVPQNLVDHWKNQIAKHTKAGQLRVFVWVDQKNVPLAHNLAWDYDIVITTFMRLSMEWAVRETSPLMHIHWLRIMLDEGHTLGASLSLTNKLQMAMSMHASRRWILTGTPMPNTPSSQVAHLQPMLKFLHEAVYGKQQKSWEGAILRPFQDGREEGRSRLMDLLHRCMTSARKAELKTIPPCVRKIKLLSFTEKHAVSYNELVVTVKRNVLMADWNDPSHVESLLNPRQWKFRSNTIKNVRLSCCVAGNIKVRNAGEDIKETMDMLEEQGMDPASEVFLTIRRALLDGSLCDRCKQWCRLPIVTPCRHLLCLSCTALDSEKCPLPGCGNPYKMQSPADLTRPENPHPKWPVPQDLIELQPSYVQDNWNPDWQSTSSSKVSYLISELNALRVAYESQATENLEPDVRETSDEILFGMKHSWCTRASKTMPPKAIVFSQFLEHINVVEKQLSDAKLEHVGMYSPMHSVNKVKSLHTFQEDPECMVLVMDSSAALGLDLSFVTHVYLMEPIWDRSVEEQVVSRAHRLGATRPVLVETLAMSGTIEEQMLRCLQDSSKSKRPRHSEQIDNLDPSRPGYRTMHDFAESNYLAHLDCVRTVACEA